MQGAGQTATFITRSGAWPVITITANNVSIRDLTITDSTKLVEGIRVSINSGVTSGLTVENVDFSNINAGGPNACGIYIYNDTSPTAPMSFSGLTARNCRFLGTNTADPSRNIGILAYPWLNLSNLYVDNCKFSNLMTGLYLGRSNVDGVTFINNEFGPVEQANYTGAPGGIYIGDSQPGFPTTYQNITVTGNKFHDYARGVNIWNYSNGMILGKVDITGNTFTNSIASSAVMITARWNAGNASTLVGPITINNNTFTENQTIRAGYAMIDIRAGIESPASQINVTGNTITFNNPTYGAAKYGMKFRGPVTNVNISGNTLDGNLVGGTSADMPPTSGIVFGTNDSTYGPMSGNAVINVLGNSIQEFVHGVAIYDYTTNAYGNLPTGAGLNLNYDSIICNSEYGVISGSGKITNAENTWWGCNDGPSGVGPGSGEEVSAKVDYDPWLVLNLSPNPLNIVAGSTATITADMTDNSNGVDSGGYVPDGSLITFSATGGTVNPPTDNTASGIATTLFTAGTTPVTFSITATAPTCYSCASANITVSVTIAPIPAQPTGTTGVLQAITTPEEANVSQSPGWTWPRPLNPAQFLAQYLTVNPQQINANQPVIISTNVVNTGDEGGNYSLVLKINGQVEQTRMVSVGPLGTQPVKFTVTKAQPGTYTINIDNQQASFTVMEAGSAANLPVINGGLVAILLVSLLIVATVAALILTGRRSA